MEKLIKNTEVRIIQKENYTVQRIIGTIIGLMEAILTFRLLFKLLGANSGNDFVHFIYNMTAPFVRLFEGIFSKIKLPMINMSAVLEPATLIAIFLTALIGWVIMGFIMPNVTNRSKVVQYTD